MDRLFGTLQNAKTHFDYPAIKSAPRAFASAIAQLERISNKQVGTRQATVLTSEGDRPQIKARVEVVLTKSQVKKLVRVLRTQADSIEGVLTVERLLGNTAPELLNKYRDALNRAIERTV